MEFYSSPESLDFSSGLFQSTLPPMKKPESMDGEAMVPDSSNLLTNSLLLANGMEGLGSRLESDHNWPISCGGPMYSQVLTTPPPEATGYQLSYSNANLWNTTCGYSMHQRSPITTSSIPVSSPSLGVTDCYLHGSSLEESPLSSPGSSSDGIPAIHEQQVLDESVYMHNQQAPMPMQPVRSRSPLVNHAYGVSSAKQSGMVVPAVPGYDYVMSSGYGPTGLVSIESQDTLDLGIHVPKGVKMPQRKGGIQLWQFLYALLSNSDKKYRDLIEWTTKSHEREFRMLEPESIAIWWGHHKNKPNMSYDKFSRSLRYYYDKGILKKIPGERYVYRFLIDPEHMYRHIGTSDCRPKLKPMPQSAKVAMTKYHKEQEIDFTAQNSPIVTKDPEPLSSSSSISEASESSLVVSNVSLSKNISSPPFSYINSSTVQARLSVSNSTASTGNLANLSAAPVVPSTLSMKRSQSLDCAYTGSQLNSPIHQSLSSCPLKTEYCEPFSPNGSSGSPEYNDSFNSYQCSPEHVPNMQSYSTATTSEGFAPITSDSFVMHQSTCNYSTANSKLFLMQEQPQLYQFSNGSIY